MGQRKRYSALFKRETVELGTREGVNAAQVARDLGLNPTTVNCWVREHRDGVGRRCPARARGGMPGSRNCAGSWRGSSGNVIFAGSGEVLRQGIEARYQMLERCRGVFPVQVMFRLLEVSLSGYYAWRDRPPSARTQRGERLSEKCPARLMREDRLCGIPATMRWRSRKAGVRPGSVANHLDRTSQPRPVGPTGPATSPISAPAGWLYLAVVVDLYSRVVVGWSMQSHPRRELVMQAVLMTLWQRSGTGPVLLRSDRGCQQSREDYQGCVDDYGLTSSMSAVGNCWDNAAVESFLGLLKRERVNRRVYATRAKAQADVFD